MRAHTFKEMKEIPPNTLKEMKEIISIVAWVKSQWVPGMTQAHLKQPGSYYCMTGFDELAPAICDLDEATRDDLRTKKRSEPSGAMTRLAALRLASPPASTATKASERGSEP